MNNLLKTFLWNVVNPILLNLKKNQIKKWRQEHIGLNMGCGIDCPPNWLGIDAGVTHLLASKLPKFILNIFFGSFNMAKNYSSIEYYKKIRSFEFIHFNLLFGLPFRNDSVPNIYSSHFIEHLKRTESSKLLKECLRVMQDGGKIRICVPALEKEMESMEIAIAEAKAGNVSSIQKYVTDKRDSFNSEFSNHKFMYNIQELKKLLSEVGFAEIQACEFKKGSIPDVSLLDTREGIFAEAIKPN